MQATAGPGRLGRGAKARPGARTTARAFEAKRHLQRDQGRVLLLIEDALVLSAPLGAAPLFPAGEVPRLGSPFVQSLDGPQQAPDGMRERRRATPTQTTGSAIDDSGRPSVDAVHALAATLRTPLPAA